MENYLKYLEDRLYLHLEPSICKLFYRIRTQSKDECSMKTIEAYADKYKADVKILAFSSKATFINTINLFIKQQRISEMIFTFSFTHTTSTAMMKKNKILPTLQWVSGESHLTQEYIGKTSEEVVCPFTMEGHVYDLVRYMNAQLFKKYFFRPSLNIDCLPLRFRQPLNFKFLVDKLGVIFLDMGVRFQFENGQIGAICSLLSVDMNIIEEIFEYVMVDEESHEFILDEEFVEANFADVL